MKNKQFFFPSTWTILSTLGSYLSAVYLGKAIASLQNKNTNPLFNIYFYLLFVVVGSLSSIAFNLSIQKIRIKNQERAWQKYLPICGSKKLKDSSEAFFAFITELYPKEKEQNILFITNTTKALLIYSLIILTAIYNKIVFALPFLVLFVTVTFLSNYFFKNQTRQHLSSAIKSKNEFFNWIDNYFKQEDAPYFNYFRENKGLYLKIRHLVGSSYLSPLYKLQKISALRNLSQFLLTDLPLYGLISYFLLITYKNHLNIGSFVCWLFLFQIMVQANNSLRAALEAKTELASILCATDAARSSFFRANPEKLFSANNSALFFSEKISISKKELSLTSKPGLYKIHGKNASGKSTLFRELRNSGNAEFYKISKATSEALSTHSIRVWNSDLYFLGNYDPVLSFLSDSYLVSKRLNEFFSKEIAESWLKNFDSLKRGEKLRDWKTLSSGERSFYNFARIIQNLSNSALIMIDEGDAFFDVSNKGLFNKTIGELSKRFPVFLIQHESHYTAHSIQSHFYGCNPENDKAWAVPYTLKMINDSKGEITALGNLAKTLEPELNRVIEILEHQLGYKFSDCSFILEAELPNIKVGDTGSVQLSLAAALCQLYAKSNGLECKTKLASTGKIMLDGRTESVAGVEAKKIAAKKLLGDNACFFSPDNIPHVSKLASSILA